MRYGTLGAITAAATLISASLVFAVSTTPSNAQSTSDAMITSVCVDPGLSVDEQASCRSAMLNAKSDDERGQIQSKYEALKTGGRSDFSNSGPTTDTPPADSNGNAVQSPSDPSDSNASRSASPEQNDAPRQNTGPSIETIVNNAKLHTVWI